MTRRKLFQVGLPALGVALWGCGSSSQSSNLGTGSANPTVTTVPTQLLRSERDSSFFFDGAGNLYQINQRTAEIQKFSPGGQRIWTIQLKGRGANQMDTPVAGTVDRQGKVWLVDRALARLQVLDGAGQPAGNVVAPSPMLRPQDIASDTQSIYVSDGYEHRVVVFDLNGQFLNEWTVGGTLNYPRGLALDSANRLHLADAGNGRVVVLSSTGQLVAEYGGGVLKHPRGLSISSAGLIAVADSVAGLIFIFSADLSLLTSFRPTSNGQPLVPLDLQFGPDGVLYLTAEPLELV